MSGQRLRLDKWLWYARFFKSRSLAGRTCAAGRVRINREIVRKSHATVCAGDVLTFPQAGRIRVVRVAALGVRRGPAAEAIALYEDLAPPEPAKTPPPGTAAVALRTRGAGRPTKNQRRAIERLRKDG
ncbi:MAG: RNA-binding S4 domain-containing protein [Alphaproteobacteria bacterium]